MTRRYSRLTAAAMLLAVMLVCQSLRLIIPLPPFISMFAVGSVVNACLLIAVEQAGWRPAVVLAVVAPVVACLQQVLPSPVFIFPVALSNLAYVLGYSLVFAKNRGLAVAAATAAKVSALYSLVAWAVNWLHFPEAVVKMVTMMLGWPQLITGVGGGLICALIMRRLRHDRNSAAGNINRAV